MYEIETKPWNDFVNRRIAHLEKRVKEARWIMENQYKEHDWYPRMTVWLAEKDV